MRALLGAYTLGFSEIVGNFREASKSFHLNHNKNHSKIAISTHTEDMI
jgi:hypothetical protein